MLNHLGPSQNIESNVLCSLSVRNQQWNIFLLFFNDTCFPVGKKSAWLFYKSFVIVIYCAIMVSTWKTCKRLESHKFIDFKKSHLSHDICSETTWESYVTIKKIKSLVCKSWHQWSIIREAALIKLPLLISYLRISNVRLTKSNAKASKFKIPIKKSIFQGYTLFRKSPWWCVFASYHVFLSLQHVQAVLLGSNLAT